MRHSADQLRLLFALSIYDLKCRCGKSVLGIFWAFAGPAATVGIFYLVFQLGLREAPVRGVPYVLWFSAAYLPWTFFSGTLETAGHSLLDYRFLIRKTAVPAHIFPLIRTISALLVHLFLLLAVIAAAGGVSPRFLVPFLYFLFSAVLFSFACARILAVLEVCLEDLASLLPVCLQLLFWTSPVLWDDSAMRDPGIRRILVFNPVRYLLKGYRCCLLSGRLPAPDRQETVVFWCWTAVFLLFGARLMSRKEAFLADEI